MDYPDIARQLENMPQPDDTAAARASGREANLTTPAGSPGRLESVRLVCRLAGGLPAHTGYDSILVFAGNHGVTAQGVSAFPPEVTHQMVANFAAGGAAINQLAAAQGANLRVIDPIRFADCGFHAGACDVERNMPPRSPPGSKRSTRLPMC